MQTSDECKGGECMAIAKCPKCGSTNMKYLWRDFDEEVRKIVRCCADCGMYLGCVREVRPYTDLVAGQWQPLDHMIK